MPRAATDVIENIDASGLPMRFSAVISDVKTWLMMTQLQRKCQATTERVRES